MVALVVGERNELLERVGIGQKVGQQYHALAEPPVIGLLNY